MGESERDRVQSVFEVRCAMLLDGLTSRQRWRPAQEWAERWITLGQTPEPAYRALMLAAFAQGNSAKLALAYERCVSALRKYFSIEPSYETTSLFQELLQGHADGPARRGHQSPVLIQP